MLSFGFVNNKKSGRDAIILIVARIHKNSSYRMIFILYTTEFPLIIELYPECMIWGQMS